MRVDIAVQIARVREQMAAAAKRAGRKPDEIELVAVSKFQPVELVVEAIRAGHRCFGENYVQEGSDKRSALVGQQGFADLRFELIGHLQRNKAKVALQVFSRIQTVDSLPLAEKISATAKDEGRTYPILVQVNISSESSKSGVEPAQLPTLLQSLQSLSGIRVEGLMTIGSFVAVNESESKRRAEFITLRTLREKMERETGMRLAELSMGMSHDFELAIEEGATIVRVGTGIFGERRR